MNLSHSGAYKEEQKQKPEHVKSSQVMQWQGWSGNMF